MSRSIVQLTEPVCDSGCVAQHYEVVIFHHRLCTVSGAWLDGSDVVFIQPEDTEQRRSVYRLQMFVSFS